MTDSSVKRKITQRKTTKVCSLFSAGIYLIKPVRKQITQKIQYLLNFWTYKKILEIPREN